MRKGLFASIGTVTVVVALAWLAAPLSGQSRTAGKNGKKWTPSKTSWGDPDLQGQWNSQTSTPLERPLTGERAGKEVLSDEEAETLENKERESFDAAPQAGDPGTYNAFWRDEGKGLKRTSLIIDPLDGRVPPLTPEAEKRVAAERA